jgi:hypothetical protein
MRNLPERDRHIAREARFGCQRVVVRRVEASIGHAVSDREQLAFPIEQEAEFHFDNEVVGKLGELRRPLDNIFRFRFRSRDRLAELVPVRALAQQVQR